jgi:hypothetical protein
MTALASHWDAACQSGADLVSWYQDEAHVSLRLIGLLKIALDAPVIDIGGGASPLVADLLDRGYQDLTVVDISKFALDTAREQLGVRGEELAWVPVDLRDWQPTRTYRLWHDRAVLHFLTGTQDQQTYIRLLTHALAAGGHAIIATFAPDGPERCSGLPVVRYSPESLAALLGPDFEVIEERREAHCTPSGSIQPFTWIVARGAL